MKLSKEYKRLLREELEECLESYEEITIDKSCDSFKLIAVSKIKPTLCEEVKRAKTLEDIAKDVKNWREGLELDEWQELMEGHRLRLEALEENKLEEVLLKAINDCDIIKKVEIDGSKISVASMIKFACDKIEYKKPEKKEPEIKRGDIVYCWDSEKDLNDIDVTLGYYDCNEGGIHFVFYSKNHLIEDVETSMGWQNVSKTNPLIK